MKMWLPGSMVHIVPNRSRQESTSSAIAYRGMYSNALWSILQMIGTLEVRVSVLRRAEPLSHGSMPARMRW